MASLYVCPDTNTSLCRIPVNSRFPSIQKALNSCSPGDEIIVSAGIYAERVVVTTNNIVLRAGEGETVKIVYSITASEVSDEFDVSGTWDCAVMTISAPGFTGQDLIIENSFDYPANATLPENHPDKIANTQAVALMLDTEADKSVFENCEISGYQDTLLAEGRRALFANCIIRGHVDFICGSAQALFNSCCIISRNRPGKYPSGYVTAPSTDISMPYGFLFYDCKFTAEQGTPSGSVCLGRPWHPGAKPRAEGACVFVDCHMDDHIASKAYAPISAVDSHRERHWFSLQPHSRFFEYNSRGPGARTGDFRPQLDPEAVRYFLPDRFFADWRADNIPH